MSSLALMTDLLFSKEYYHFYMLLSTGGNKFGYKCFWLTHQTNLLCIHYIDTISHKKIKRYNLEIYTLSSV